MTLSRRVLPVVERRRLLLVVATAWLGAACAADPLAREDMTTPALLRIHDRFRATVERARADDETRWVSGWSGNVRVAKAAQSGENVRGYCWEWQALVRDAVRPVVRDLGWELAEIEINRGWFSEHHAVVVWDPRRLRREEVLGPPAGEGAWVLDPWMNGEAEIYRLSDWLDLPWIVFEPPALEPEVGGGTAGPAAPLP